MKFNSIGSHTRIEWFRSPLNLEFIEISSEDFLDLPPMTLLVSNEDGTRYRLGDDLVVNEIDGAGKDYHVYICIGYFKDLK